VAETGERQLGRARAASDRVLRLEHEHGATSLRKGDRGCEPIRARADDDRV
jgi:hypothetical protein